MAGKSDVNDFPAQLRMIFTQVSLKEYSPSVLICGEFPRQPGQLPNSPQSQLPSSPDLKRIKDITTKASTTHS